MKKLGLLALLGLFVFASAGVQAAEKKDFQGIFEDCGIGGLLFPNWAVGASVSNFIWDYGTTASTSGLTTPDSCKGGKAKLAAYIFESYDSIEKELAKGSGEYVDALAMLSATSLEKDDFVASVRSDFGKVVASEEYTQLSRVEKAQKIFDIVSEYSELS